MKSIRELFVLFSVVLFGSMLQAATLKVGTGETYTTIQSAITAAAANDTIEVAAGTYTENVTVDKSLVIIGVGPATTIVDGDGDGHVFFVNGDIEVAIGGFTLRNGSADSGGGVFVQAGLGLDSYLALSDCVFSNNVATADNGGGLANLGLLEKVVLENCTFNGNTAASGKGGAVSVIDGDLMMANCTISANTAKNGGGCAFNNGTTIDLQHITVTLNAATNSPASRGGGLHLGGASGTVSNSIVCANTDQFSGTTTDNIYGTLPGGSNNVVDQDAKLAALADNGGPTPTHALLADSPAIDAGATSDVTVDQRGVSRTQGTAPDAGAFEVVFSADVNATYTGATPGWGMEKFATIQAAVEAVPESATVNVAAGTYKEFVVINKALTLKGAFAGTPGYDESRDGSNESIILAPDSAARIAPAGTTTHLINNYAANVVIDGFTLQHDRDASGDYGANGGIRSRECSVDIKNNRVIGLPKFGIYVSRSAGDVATSGAIVDVEISANYITGTALSDLSPTFGNAIQLLGAVADILDNVIDQTRVGIAVQPYNQPDVEISTDGLVSGNTFKTYSSGVFFHAGGVSGHYAVSGNWMFNNNAFSLITDLPAGIETHENYTAVNTRMSKCYFDKAITYSNNTFDVSNLAQISYTKTNIQGFTFRNDMPQHEASDINLVYANNTFTSDDFVSYFNSESIGNDNPAVKIELAAIRDANNFTDSAVVYGEDLLVAPSKVNVVNTDQKTGFDTIQAAYTAANSGDTITVAAGTYAESFTLDKSVNLVGLDPQNKPLLEGMLTLTDTSATATRIENINFKVNATDKNNLRLEGVKNLTVKGCDFDGDERFMGSPGVVAIQLRDACENITVENCTFHDGYYVAIQGYMDKNLVVKNSTITNVKSGINIQSANADGLTLENTDISVVAQGAANDSYCVRFASATGTAKDMSISGGTFTVDENGFTPEAGTYFHALIVRDAATGTLEVNGTTINGQIVNLSNTLITGADNSCLYVYVDDDYTDSTSGWGEYAFSSIENAVTAVLTGGTVNVAAGTYKEFVVINKALTLQGAFAGIAGYDESRDGSNESIILAPDSAARIAPAGTTTHLINNYAANVVIDGFTLQHDQDGDENYGANGGIRSRECSVDIKNNRVIGLPKFGVYVSRSAGDVATSGAIDDVEISANYITGTALSDLSPTFGNAIQLLGAVADILDNVIDQTRVGIAVQPYNQPLVKIETDGRVSGNTVETYSSGVFFHAGGVSGHYAVSGNWTFDNNTFSLITDLPEGIETHENYTAVNTRMSKCYFDKAITYSNNIFDVSNLAQISYTKTNVQGFTFRNDMPQHDASDINLVYANNTFTSDDFVSYFNSESIGNDNPAIEIDLAAIRDANTFTDGAIVYGEDLLVSSSKVNVVNTDQKTGFDTIQAALGTANSGDTITVAAGTYTESFTLDKSINIVGLDPQNKPLIEGMLTLTDTSATATRIEDVDFKVNATDKNNLRLEGVKNLTVKGCDFDGTGRFMGSPGVVAIQLRDACENITVENCTFHDGYYVAIQGYIDENLVVKNSTITNVKSGINIQSANANGLTLENTDISVVAQGAANDSYCVRFGSATGTAKDMSISGGTFTVDENGFTPEAGTYFHALIVRDAATGTLEVNGTTINGQIANFSETLLTGMNNDYLYVYVDDNYTGSTSGWGEYAFSSIETAVTAVAAGGTVYVADGTYAESFTLANPVNIVGAYSVVKPLIEGMLTLTDTSETATRIEDIDFKVNDDDKNNLRLEGVKNLTVKGCDFDGVNRFMAETHVVAIQLRDACENITVENCTFHDGYYVAIQGYMDKNLIVKNSTITNVKSGINIQSANADGLTLENTDISVVAQGAANDTYCVRFASATGIAQGMSISDGTFTVDEDGLTPDAGTYFHAIIVRDAATGTLVVNGTTINGQIVNLSGTPITGTGNSCLYVYVDDDFDANTSGWGEYAFSSIENAVIAVLVGGTVNVAAGTYNENVVLDKALNLVGADQTTTTINGEGSGKVVWVKSNDVLISGFKITGSGNTPLDDAGVILENVEGCMVKNCTISDNPGVGIGLLAANANTILDNTLTNNTITGIGLMGALNNAISNNIVSATKQVGGNFGYGIVLDGIDSTGGDHPNLFSTGNNIGGNTCSANLGDGIYLGWNCNGNAITDNTLVENGNDGLYIWKASANTITGNIITDNLAEGVQLMASADNVIAGNSISGSATSLWIRSGWTQYEPHSAGHEALSSNNTIQANSFIATVAGVVLEDNPDYTLDDSGLVDVSANYWGTPFGPSGEDYFGTGSAIIGAIDIASYLTSFDPSVSHKYNLYVNISFGENREANQFKTIQAAYDYANPGDTIHVADGNYTLASTLAIMKRGITVVGYSEAGVIIDASGNGTSYGIKVEADDVTLKKFTLLPPQTGATGTTGGGYAIHATFNHGTPRAPHSNLRLENITVANGNRAAFDVHGYDGVILENLTATGSTYGNGIQIAGCTDVSITGCTITGNAWGDIAFYSSQEIYLGRPTTDVTFDIEANTIDGVITVEDEFGFVNSVVINGADFAIHNVYSETASMHVYTSRSILDAIAIANGLEMKYANGLSEVTSADGTTAYAHSTRLIQVDDDWAGAAANTEYTVGGIVYLYGVNAFDALQAGVNAAQAGGTVNVAAGNYVLPAGPSGTLTVDKALTITGAGIGNSIIDATGTGSQRGIHIVSSDVTFEGFSITPPNGAGYPLHVAPEPVTTASIPLNNIVLRNLSITGSNKTAFDIHAVNNVTLKNLVATGSNGNGIQFTGCNNAVVDGCSLSGNTWGGVAVYVSKGLQAGSSGVTVTNCTTTEDTAVYSQTDGTYPITGLNVQAGYYLVHLGGDNYNWVNSLQVALDTAGKAIAAGLTPTITDPDENPVVMELSKAVVYVDDDYSIKTAGDVLEINGGYFTYGYNAFDNISAAVTTVDEAGTINVNDGTYTENVEINVPNLTLKSTAGRDLTIVDNPSVGEQASGISVLKNMGTVTVEGFTVNNFRNGITQGHSQSVGTSFIVKNCKVIPENNDTEPYLRNGIQVTGDGSQIIGNHVVGAPLTSAWASTAIGVVNASDVLVQGNHVNTSTADIGINILNYSSDIVENITVVSNYVNGAKSGISITGKTNTLNVQDVFICDNDLLNSPSYGINIQKVTLGDLSMIGNTITGSGSAGIRSSQTSAILAGDILIENNEFSENGYYGILYSTISTDDATLTVTGNTITGHSYAGIQTDSTAAVIIKDNDLLNNGSYGVRSLADSALTVTGNIITGHSYAGIQMDSTAAVLIKDNDLSGNDYLGVYNKNATTVDAKNNWWGDSSGPENFANPGGVGSMVYGKVDFSPWLSDGTDMQPETIGFQPNQTPVYYKPASLVFTQQPGGAALDGALDPQPVVTVLDEIGQVATQFVGNVSLSISANPGLGQLAGTSSMSATAGVANFNSVAIANDGGEDFKLTATVGSLAVESDGFTITNPSLILSSIDPIFIVKGSEAFTLTVSGSGFVPSSEVLWNGVARDTTYVSANQLTTTILETDVADAGTAQISVASPAASDSDALTFTITATTLAPEVYVNASWDAPDNCDNNVWGYDAFATIQSAIDGVAENGVIKVYKGTYEENAASAADKKIAWIAGVPDGTTLPTIHGSLALNSDDGCVLENISFLVKDAHTLTLKNQNGLIVRNCVFDGNGLFMDSGKNGINASGNGNSDVTVENCLFQDGLYCAINAYINNLTITNSTFVNVKSGVNLQKGDNLVVQDCDISVIAQSQTDSYGIRFANATPSSTGLTITGCNISSDPNGKTPEAGEYHCALYLRAKAAGTLKITDSNINGAVVNLSESTTLNASGNWWGGNDQATIIAKINTDSTSPVDYSPWLDVGTDTDEGNVGFKGDFSTLWVDDDSPQSGTVGLIQEGVNLVDEAGTINVAAGTYTGSITVNKESATLLGAGPEITLVNSSGTTPAFTVTANGVSIRQIGITNPEHLEEAICVDGATEDLTLADVNMTNLGNGTAANTYGLRLKNSFDGLHVTNCQFIATDLEVASRVICMYAPGNLLLKNFLVEDSSFENFFTGIYLSSDIDGLVAQRNTFGPMELADCTACAAGIYIGDGTTTSSFNIDNVLVKDNTFTSYARGVYIWNYTQDEEVRKVDIVDNTFENSIYSSAVRLIGRTATVATLEGPITIAGNTITQSTPIVGGGGVAMIDLRAGAESATSQLSVTDNTITFTGPFSDSLYGIQLRGPVTVVDISGNELLGNDAGGTHSTYPSTSGIILLSDSMFGPIPASAAIGIANNQINGFINGVSIYDDVEEQFGGLADSSSLIISENDLSGNGTAIAYGDGAKFNAENNWWGDSSGPAHASNPGSAGVTVSGNVDYSPWLGDGTDTQPTVIGFQPNLEPVHYIDPTCTLEAVSLVYNGQAQAANTPAIVGGTVSSTLYRLDGTEDEWQANVSNVGVYDVQISVIGDDDHNDKVFDNDQALTITTKALTIAAPSVTKVYDGARTPGDVTVGAISGLVDSETVTATGTATVYPDKNVGSAYSVTVSYALADGANGGLAANYNLVSSEIGNAAITPQALTITAPSVTKVYDGETTPGDVTVGAISGFIADESVAATGTAKAYNGKDVGSAYSVTVSYSLADGANGGLAANYSLADSEIQNAAITKRELTAVVVDTPTKTYDGNNTATLAPANYTLSTLVSGETITVNQSAGTYASKDVGTHLVSVTLAQGDFAAGSATSLANYTLPVEAEGDGTITAKAATVVANPKAKNQGDANPELTATVTGTASGDTINYTLATTADESSVVGVYDITVTLGSNPNYEVSTNNSTLTVVGATQDCPGFRSPSDSMVVSNSLAFGEITDLTWTPILPTGWTVLTVDTLENGVASVVEGAVVYSTLPTSPASITYTVEVPGNAAVSNAVAATVSFNGVTADVAPINIYRYHSADYRRDIGGDFDGQFRKIDSTEINRVLSYWRAGGYKLDSAGHDGFAAQPGSVASGRHSADYRTPFGKIDVHEAMLVQTYWRAGGYHVDSTTDDGYAHDRAGIGPRPMSLLAMGMEPVVSLTKPTVYNPGQELTLTSTFQNNTSEKLLGFCWELQVPNGWRVTSVSGDGSPELGCDGKSVLLTASTLSRTQISLTFTVSVPLNEIRACSVGCESSYMFDSMSKTATLAASENAIEMIALDATGDGMADSWAETFGITNADGDADGDGMSNLEEYLSGTVPTDETSYLRMINVKPTPDGVEVSWASEIGRVYTLRRAVGQPAGFTDFVTDLEADGSGRNTYVDDSGEKAPCFYRVSVKLQQ